MEEKAGCAEKKKGKADTNRISERAEGRKIRVCEEGRGGRRNCGESFVCELCARMLVLPWVGCLSFI